MKRISFLLMIFFVFGVNVFLSFELSADSLNEKIIEDLTIDFIEGKNKSFANVTIRLNYSFDKQEDISSAEELEKLREKNRNFHSESNYEILKAFPELHSEIEVSEYAPFLFVKYFTYENYMNDFKNIKMISKMSNVLYIHVECSSYNNLDSSINTGLTNLVMTKDMVRSMINIGQTSFTGKGIKIGVIDSGNPILNTTARKNLKTTCPIQEDTIIAPYHTSRVLSCLAGEMGLATDSEIYLYQISATYDNSETTFEKLLDDGVNIISFSGCYSKQYGIYSEWCLYADYLVSHNKVTMVVSAGNDSSKFVNDLGIALNVITVGAVDALKNVSSISAYKIKERYSRYINKPNLVAPGENINLIINGITYTSTGTSFSTPLVSGIIAMLMEEFPAIKYKPGLIMNALMHSATKLPSQTEEFDDASGAGIVNYQKCRDILRIYQEKVNNYNHYLEDNNFQYFENMTIDESNFILENYIINMNFEDDCIGSFVFYCQSSELTLSLTSFSETYYQFNKSTIANSADLKYTRYRLEICPSYDEEALLQFGSFSNNMKTKFNLPIGQYYTVKLFMINSLPSTAPDVISIILSK